jgi:hypothetical protein
MTVKLERDPNDPRGYMATSGEWTLEYAYDFWETYPGCVSSVKMAASLGGNWNDENWFKLSYDPQTLAGYVQIAITPRGTYEEHNAICGNAAQTVPHEASESMGSTGWTLEVQGQRQGDGIRFVLDQNVVGSDTPDNRSFTTITGGILLTP